MELDPPNNIQLASVLPEPHETLHFVEEDVNMAGATPPEGPLPVPLPRIREGWTGCNQYDR